MGHHLSLLPDRSRSRDRVITFQHAFSQQKTEVIRQHESIYSIVYSPSPSVSEINRLSGTHPFSYFGDISSGLEAHRSTWNAAKFGKINAFLARQEEDATQNDVAIHRAVKIVDASSIEARNVPGDVADTLYSNSGVPRPVFVPVIKVCTSPGSENTL